MPPSLRRRVYRVLLQWFLLFALVAAVVATLSASGVRRGLVEDRVLLARTIAHAMDGTVSMSLQHLGRLASELPLPGDATAALRDHRLHSAFREAAYVLDARGRLLAADPPDVRPLPAALLQPHEVATALVRKSPDDPRPVVALVQPFRRGTASYHLVSEMFPLGSSLTAFLQGLETDPDTHVALVDEHGVVIGSPDRAQVFRVLPQGGAYGERIRAKRPLVAEGQACEFAGEGHPATDVLSVMVPLRFAPWGVVVEQHAGRAFAALETTRRGLLIAGALLAVMGLVLTRAISRSVVAPIRQLWRQAETMRGGDLSRPITVSGDLEVEVLGRTLEEARARLASTLAELRALNESLEFQVAARTRDIEAKYRDLSLLHAVGQVATQERDIDRIVPAVLRLVAQHCGFAAAALVSRPPERPPSTYAVPSRTALPWLAGPGAPPDDWQRREITHQGGLEAELFHPRVPGLDERVMEALCHQLAISLHGVFLWQRTVEQDEQRQVLVRRLLDATEEERRRIARELHDEISQLLTVIQLSLDRVAVPSPEVDRAKGLLGRTQKEIHRIIHDLRPSLLDDLGLPAAMRAYAGEHLVKHGLGVSLEIDDALPARSEVEITLFRIYQELLTNILRHARAEHVSVELYERDGRLTLAVEDDGVGFDPGEKFEGVGLTGMRERAAIVGGTVRLDSEPGLGTHVVVEIPAR